MKTILASFLATLLILPALASTVMYVTDQTKVPLRTGKSTGHKILRMIPSGAAVTVLEKTADGYAHVRTAQGVDGWMLARMLMPEPSARDRLGALQERYQALQGESSRLKQQLGELETANAELKQQNEGLRTANERLQKEVDKLRRTAARPLELEKQNKYLQVQLNEEQETVRQLRNENQLLRDETKRKWFLTGTAVTLGSLFLGLIIPRIPWRKRRGWSEL